MRQWITKIDGMGCDIHMLAEIREDGKTWKLIEECPCVSCDGTGKRTQGPPGDQKLVDCHWCDGIGVRKVKRAKSNEDYNEHPHPYTGQNYRLFSILAGVRRYDDDVEPVYPPRGIPEDACRYIKEAWKEEEGDGHTPSYLNVHEIEQAFVVRHGLLVEEHVQEEAKKDREWCKDFLDGTLKKLLLPIAEQIGKENVRIVFWFDN